MSFTLLTNMVEYFYSDDQIIVRAQGGINYSQLVTKRVSDFLSGWRGWVRVSPCRTYGGIGEEKGRISTGSELPPYVPQGRSGGKKVRVTHPAVSTGVCWFFNFFFSPLSFGGARGNCYQ